jgi:four helix bundle protein
VAVGSEIKSHKDLIVWQKALALAVSVYRLAKAMPRAEEYRLTGQMARAAASIPANIAEGHARGTRKDYANFVNIARGSLAELDTFLLLVIETGLIEPETVRPILTDCDEVGRMLTSLSSRLRDIPPKT